MLFHIFISRLKIHIRNKEALMWSLAFSLVLGTLFFVAFSSIYKSSRNTTIPVALVEGEGMPALPVEDLGEAYDFLQNDKYLSESSSFSEMLGNLTYEDGTKILRVKTADMEEAKTLLEKEKVDGIIDTGDVTDIKLLVKKSGIHQSILTSIVSTFRQYVTMITETALHSPQELEGVLNDLEEELSFVEEKSLSGENKDPYVAYFYNLIAMMCMMASMAGVAVPIECQANLSDVGARVNVSPIHKGVYEFIGLLAALIVQIVITMIGLTYLIFGLGIQFGGNTLVIYLTAILGTVLGVSLGFFIGHIGNLSSKTKYTLLTTVTVGGGFLSGLMFAQMKVIIEKNVPFLNRINPSAVITDAFYSINMFGISGRYYRAILYMVLLTVVFLICGLIMSRRKSYASL
ncbi:MAG: ABC transporter permease [Lachnospiraceae bacterium]|nr:ABC transporter permease [Lachnospiraceae bacterium]